MATTKLAEHPATALDRVLAGATNDQALELIYKLLENLAERSENAADVAIDSGDRDLENEAHAFVSETLRLMPHFGGGINLTVWSRTNDAKDDIQAAIRNRRAIMDGRTTRLEQFSRRRQQRVSSAWEAQRRHEQQATEKLVKRANITSERILEAIRRVDLPEFQAKHVAVALMPELEDTSITGRQAVINRVSRAMLRLVKAGQLRQHRPEDGQNARVTCRYSLEARDA